MVVFLWGCWVNLAVIMYCFFKGKPINYASLCYLSAKQGWNKLFGDEKQMYALNVVHSLQLQKWFRFFFKCQSKRKNALLYRNPWLNMLSSALHRPLKGYISMHLILCVLARFALTKAELNKPKEETITAFLLHLSLKVDLTTSFNLVILRGFTFFFFILDSCLHAPSPPIVVSNSLIKLSKLIVLLCFYAFSPILPSCYFVKRFNFVLYLATLIKLFKKAHGKNAFFICLW